MCRQLLLALISKRDEILQAGAVLNKRFMREPVAVAADEFILVTAAVRYGFVRSIVQKTLQAHGSAVKRQCSKLSGSVGHKRKHPDAPASCADAGQKPAKQLRVGFAAAVSSDGPAGAAVRRAADRGISMSDDGSGSGRDSTSGDGGSTANTATATVVAAKQRSSRSSKAGGSCGGSSRSSSEAAWDPLFAAEEAACCSGQDRGESLQQGPMLRPRGAKGLVQGVALKDPAGCVGRRISVWWPDMNTWYLGTVTVSICSVMGMLPSTQARHQLTCHD
jgi:hypothetical protein